MWNMNSGDSVLKGKFRELFLNGVAAALDEYISTDDCWPVFDDDLSSDGFSYHAAFDRIGAAEKAYAIMEVTRCLTTKCDKPALFQWNESAVYAVFEVIFSEVLIEMDVQALDGTDEHSYFWRSLVSAAERERREECEDWPYISVGCQDRSEWESLILETLADEILWDRDFEDDVFADKTPKEAAAIGVLFGISGDYYSTPVPLVTPAVLKQSKKSLLKTLKTI